MPQIDKGTRIWEVLKKDFEKRFLEKDGVRHALARLVKSGVDRDRLLKGLMHTVAHIEALRDILPEARYMRKEGVVG